MFQAHRADDLARQNARDHRDDHRRQHRCNDLGPLERRHRRPFSVAPWSAAERRARRPPSAARAAENRIPAANSNKLSRFRRASEPGMLSLPVCSTDRAATAVPAENPILNPIVLIPARLAASRLPDKPLALIAGVPMIVHVWRRAVAAAIGPVVVACGDRAIAETIEREGGRVVMTDPA